MSRLTVLLLCLTLVPLGCRHKTDAPAPEMAGLGQKEDPALAFQELERHLLTSDAVYLPLDIKAEGSLGARLKGRFSTETDHGEVLEARGQFAEQPVTLSLHEEGGRLVLVGAQGQKTMERPAQTREALLLGLTRMGVLHNLALLRATAAPDGSNGDMGRIVSAGDHRFLEDRELGGKTAHGLAFTLTTSDGKQVGEASLWFDPRTGKPLWREQVVRFPNGDMRVTECYLPGGIPDAR